MPGLISVPIIGISILSDHRFKSKNKLNLFQQSISPTNITHTIHVKYLNEKDLGVAVVVITHGKKI